MANSLIFDTRAQFDTALASGGSINAILNGVTSVKPSVSVIALVKESGESFACGMNVMVDIKSVGPGDYVMYDNVNDKFFGISRKWIDNNYPGQPTQQTMLYKQNVLPSRYVLCGSVVYRHGNRIRLAGVSESLAWSQNVNTSGQYEWDVADLTKYTWSEKENGEKTTQFETNNHIAFPSQRYQEDYFKANPNASYLPITRADWNAAMLTLGNDPAATITIQSKTVVPATYNYDFDVFMRAMYHPKKWPKTGAYLDMDGRVNTRKIVTDFIANHGKTAASVDYAAGYCYNYAVAAPGLGAHQWFLGTIRDVAELCAIRHTLRTKLAWRTGYLWSSTQYSAGTAWGLNYSGHFTYAIKSANLTAVPLSDLILTT